MKLSVIIPVYQAERSLERCLDSVAGQSLAVAGTSQELEMEIVVVDDGSTDGSPQICDRLAAADSRIRVVHRARGGVSEARNTGIDVATGAYITFVDADDHLAPMTYQPLLKLAEEGHDIVEFPYTRQGADGSYTPAALPPRTYTDMGHYWLTGRTYEHTYVWNKLFRASLFDGVRFPRGEVFEEVATLPLLLEKAKSVAVSKEGLYYYNYSPKSLTRTAQGEDLSTLLHNHLEVMPRWCDDRYYMHVLNIQLDVCRLTGATPTLPLRRVNPCTSCPGLSAKLRLKALLLNVVGVDGLVRINKSMHKLWGRR